MMTVRLIAHTPEPEKVVAAAAKLCYSDAHITDLLDGLDEEKTARFLTMLSDLGHASPIEHASFTFGIEGVSRTLLAQITRHRIASFSVQSQRYVRLDDFRYVIPPEIEAIPEAKAAFIESMNEDARRYLDLVQKLEDGHTARLMAEGLPEKQARAKASKRPLRAAQRLRDQDGGDHERPQPAELLPPALLQPRPVGDTAAGRRDAAAGLPGGTPYLPHRRPGLRVRPLPGGQDVLRPHH